MIEPKTDLEIVLYEERQHVLRERNEAKEELRLLKDKYSNDFSVTSIYSESYSSVIVKKGSSVVSLDSEELRQIIKFASKNNFI